MNRAGGTTAFRKEKDLEERDKLLFLRLEKEIGSHISRVQDPKVGL